MTVERVSDKLRLMTGRLRVVHSVMLLHTPNIIPVRRRIGADHISREIAAQFPEELAVGCEFAETRSHFAHGNVNVSRRVPSPRMRQDFVGLLRLPLPLAIPR